MKYLVPAIAVAVLVLPVFANAQTAIDVSAQAQALLQQINALQAQLGLGSPSSGQFSAGTGACYSGGPVKPGTTSANVTALQQFLASDPSVYPEAKVTGYYGALTQAAVGRWQAKNGIVSSGSPSTTGYGNVGPKTAAAMAASCGGSDASDPVVGGFIKVSPILGDAPLTVNAEATINTTKSCLPATYTITWGDNSAPISISIPAGKCDVLAQTYSHTYTSGGSFTVTLASGDHATTATVGVNGTASMNMSGSNTSNTNTNTSTGGTAANNSTSGQVTSGVLTISMNGSKFSPGNTTISSGTKVTWKNDDTTNHTVTADNGSYNSGPIMPGGSYSLTFTAVGEYTYYCTYHGGPGGSGMAGKIIVQ